MVLKRIPKNIQLILSASNQINNYHKAIEELVYNALDANATSIAIRINIQDNRIQVIDNGCGVSEYDIKFIGQKYMTSKLVNLSTLQAAPNKYGYRGQCLAHIINVSKYVKIISRHENSEETWMKLFEHGKEKQIKEWTLRPSKGVTIEINGFLYNLGIHKKLNDYFNELQSVKTFLEHLSLIHNNISLSLRDDSKNDIVFKMHKNRDMYHTLSSLYNVEKDDVQELKVEKNEYKVTAFIGKSDREIGKHLIFLNGKFISSSSKLHKILKSKFNKNFICGDKNNAKVRVFRDQKENECNLYQRNVPFYFIFITCPYMDYELCESSKQSVLEFKDWNQVKMLMEKLIMFYNGDTNLKLKNVEISTRIHHIENSDNRKKVKEIMEKIMGHNYKNTRTLHVQKGIKGKQVKRKSKKPIHKNTLKITNPTDTSEHLAINLTSQTKNKHVIDDLTNDTDNNRMQLLVKTKSNKSKNIHNNNIRVSKISNFKSTINESHTYEFQKLNKNKANANKTANMRKNNEANNKRLLIKNNIIKKFEYQTNSVKKRCNKLEKKAKNIHQKIKNRKFEVFVNENVQYNSIIKDNVKYSLRKQIDEIVIHDFSKFRNELFTYNYVNNRKKEYQCNYDLLQTILNSQIVDNTDKTVINNNKPQFPFEVDNQLFTITDMNRIRRPALYDKSLYSKNTKTNYNFLEPQATYQSHNYFKCQTNQKDDHVDLETNKNDSIDLNKKAKLFISKQSKDNFKLQNNLHLNNIFKKKIKKRCSKQLKSNIKRLFNQTSKLFNMKNQIMGHSTDLSCSFDITQCSSPQNLYTTVNNGLRENDYYVENIDVNDHISTFTNTNTRSQIKSKNKSSTINGIGNEMYCTHTCKDLSTPKQKYIEGTTAQSNRNEVTNDNQLNKINIIFISTSQKSEQNLEIIDPRNICEVVIHDQSVLRNFQDSFNNSHLSYLNVDTDLRNLKGNNGPEELSNRQVVPDKCENVINKDMVKNKNQNSSQNQYLNTKDDIIEVSHHFDVLNNNHVISENENINLMSLIESECHDNVEAKLPLDGQVLKPTSIVNKSSSVNGFNLNNRICFLPKGMSPIFKNCNTKNDCEYNLSKDYYEDDMYNNFADKIRNNAEIFKPRIQEVKELTTKAIDKVNAKITKDNASLKFSGQSLKEAKVLGQIDQKFIAATLKKGQDSGDISENFLVLFDQHAVHERIRLEMNLTEYFIDNQWKPINIDEITLKMSSDHILYLHNYKKKFTQLGLQWNVNSEDVSFATIPEAMIGKNPRQADKVTKAVRNLIIEEINIIKTQGGCISLYPKSIMELVFSEACRYAIKFGDKLSKSECEDLLDKLSNCKTPFQCAHGRPVMAVIMEVQTNRNDYKWTLDNLMKWKKNRY